MKRCLILVEGQTEERFVKDVLCPTFHARGLFLFPTILTTRLVKDGPDFKGGVTRYPKLRSDLTRLLADKTAVVTTMIDYYGLPKDTPGLADRPATSGRDRAIHVQTAIHQDLGQPKNLLPFLTLHEFEALLFVNPAITAAVIPDSDRAAALCAAMNGLEPEEINETPASSPSKRLEKVFPSYKKTLHGPTAAKRIGLAAIRARCPHFDQWLTALESFCPG